MSGRRARTFAIVVSCVFVFGAVSPDAQVQMPNFKEMSGSVLPVSDLPAGTVTIRVIRGSNDKNIAGQTVEFTVDGKKRSLRTDANGRAEVTGLKKGAAIRALAIVDGERLESKDAVIGDTGLRIILVATDPELEAREAEDRRLAAGPPVKGMVVLGPESRVIAELPSDRLTFFYILQIINSARTPVDIGAPLIFELPRDARGARILDESTPQATANGPRITVVGPFAPGVTKVEAAYELPYTGDTARLTQRWPIALDRTIVMVQQLGGIRIESGQLTSKQDVKDRGQSLIFGTGPGLAAGQALELSISGLPHHATWPRNLALALASVIVAAGFWGVFTAPSRRRAA